MIVATMLIVLWMPTASAAGNVTVQKMPSEGACLVVKNMIEQEVSRRSGYSAPTVWCKPLAGP